MKELLRESVEVTNAERLKVAINQEVRDFIMKVVAYVKETNY